jgi:hypothetical protein
LALTKSLLLCGTWLGADGMRLLSLSQQNSHFVTSTTLFLFILHYVERCLNWKQKWRIKQRFRSVPRLFVLIVCFSSVSMTEHMR